MITFMAIYVITAFHAFGIAFATMKNTDLLLAVTARHADFAFGTHGISIQVTVATFLSLWPGVFLALTSTIRPCTTESFTHLEFGTVGLERFLAKVIVATIYGFTFAIHQHIIFIATWFLARSTLAVGATCLILGAIGWGGFLVECT
jgi:hypothetical protein